MYSYTAYGLCIHSALPLPELVNTDGEADVIIRIGKTRGVAMQENGALRHFYATREGICLSWRGVCALLVSGGREITVDPNPEIGERMLRNFILGPGLGVLLHQRGLPVFHASVVGSSSDAVAFMALKQRGKSTIAVALHIRGYGMLADDIMALDMNNGRPIVRSGVPQFKLWPDTIQAIGENPESHSPLYPDLEKRARRVSSGFVQNGMPLRCVYVLGVGEEIAIERLRPKEALFHVLPHWYGALFDGALLDLFGRENHFRECAFLVKNVPIYLLRRPASLTALPDVAQLVEKHLG